MSNGLQLLRSAASGLGRVPVSGVSGGSRWEPYVKFIVNVAPHVATLIDDLDDDPTFDDSELDDDPTFDDSELDDDPTFDDSELDLDEALDAWDLPDTSSAIRNATVFGRLREHGFIQSRSLSKTPQLYPEDLTGLTHVFRNDGLPIDIIAGILDFSSPDELFDRVRQENNLLNRVSR